MKKSNINSALLFVPLLVSVCILSMGCSRTNDVETQSAIAADPEAESKVTGLIEAEDLLLDLSPRLAAIGKWFEQHSDSTESELPSDLRSLVSVQGLAANLKDLEKAPDSQSIQAKIAWPIDASAAKSARNPWLPLSALKANWETTKFGVISVNFQSDDAARFVMHTKVESKGRTEDGGRLGLNGHQTLIWQRTESNESQLDKWMLVEWVQEDMQIVRAPRPMFSETLATAFGSNARSLSKAQRSYKDEIMLEASGSGKNIMPAPQFQRWTNATSNHIFPSVSVVDYDNDGHDDLFLTARWGPTQMLRNMGDGTFTETTYDIGMFFEYMVNCAVFADFDNDGDQDAIIGRPMETAVYMINEDGMFRDATEELSDIGQQYFTSGIAVSDVNRDGLLDVYLSNYPPLRNDKAWGKEFLSPEEFAEMEKHQTDSHRFLNLAGSANVLLMNRGGGKLERVPFDEELSQWRRSFQSAWADFDNDGDDDLYICNDFAPDALLRNDTPQGALAPVFVDVTNEVLADQPHGFGMGASWGDFDLDGDLDLYVSNMYSKAGTRIMAQVGSVDPRLQAAAAGNFLFQNNKGKFAQRAGSEDGFHVNKVGWSFGGQWADFDNDGFLDLYVPSGYYTAPKEIETLVDT